MITIKILGKKGHEEIVDLTPEQAKKVITDLQNAEDGRYFIVDLNTHKLVKELKLQENQELAIIPYIRGG